MTQHIAADFHLVDHLNPGFGYRVKITNACTGDVLLHRSNHPVTLNELLTPAACLDLIAWFLTPGKLENDVRCALCEEIVPAGTIPKNLAEYDNYDADLEIESTDTAHRDCAKSTGDKRWRYYE